MRLVLFFTWDVSLEIWQSKGLLQRELELYRGLARSGVDITLVTWGGARDLEIARTACPEFKVVPVYSRMPRPDNKLVRGISSFYAPFFLKDVMAGKAVLKTNQVLGAWIPLLCKFIYRKKMLVRAGYEYYDFTVRGGYGFLRKAFAYVVCMLAYFYADHIFLATQSDKEFVSKTFRIPHTKITVCPNWIDTAVFSPGATERSKKDILFVGRLSPQKNLPALIEALAGLPYSLEIVGIGELESALREQAQRVQADVRFTGAVPNDMLPDKYRNCALYVLPSFYEGNPKTLLEAMACGAAVLGTDVSGIRDVIAHEATGLLCAPDALSLRAGIQRLMEDESLRERLGQAAREAILRNNTLAAQIEREVQFLRVLTETEIY